MPSSQHPPPRVVVVGGANVDLKAQTTGPSIPATSNPGAVRSTAGGVGRNIAEVIGRLGTSCALVSAVADDAAGRMILQATADAGVDVSAVRTDAVSTGRYVAVLDGDGELVVAVADMQAVEGMTDADVSRARPLIEGADVVVLDGNLLPEVLGHAWDMAVEVGARVVIDPVSVPKAARMAALLGAGRQLDVLTPNTDELMGGLGMTPADLLSAGVGAVWERRGALGSLLHTADGPPLALPPDRATVVDVTGAGDAMVGGMVHALACGADLSEACAHGRVVATAVLGSPDTVPRDLADRVPPVATTADGGRR